MTLYEKIIELIYKNVAIQDVYSLIKVSKKFLNVYRQMDVRDFIIKSNDKNKKLKIFINFYRYLPKQGSIEWLKNKKGDVNKPPVIGGSEMEKIIKNPRELAQKKLEPQSFYGNIHTRWGNLFEDVLSSIFDLLLNTTSEETGSIPGFRDENGNIIQAYSPDRLMCVNKKRLKKLLFANFNKAIKNFEKEYLDFHNLSENKVIILNEFKCPSVRIPDGTIPKEYIYQPITGSCTIPIVDLSLFTNVSFRKCKISDFKINNIYDIDFHNKDEMNIINGFGNPLFMGMIGIYDTDIIQTEPIQTESIQTETEPEEGKSLFKILIDSIKILYNYKDNVEQPNETDIKPLNNDVIYNLYLKLTNNVLNDINTPGSDFYKLELNINNLIFLSDLCDQFLYYIYKNKILINDRYKILVLTINKLIDIPDGLEKFILDVIKINSNILVNNEQKEEQKQESYGFDLGTLNSSNLNFILEKTIENRNKDKGYHIYYCDGIIVSNDISNEINIKLPKIPENYLDPTLSDDEKYQKWLKKNIQIFVNFCKVNKYKPIGVLPWKLFKICVIPMFNNPDFLNKHKTTIYKVVETVQDIKRKSKIKFTNETNEIEIKQFYQQELDIAFRPKRKIAIKNKLQKNTFDRETLDSFNDL